MYGFDEEQRHAKALFYVGPAYSGVSFHQHTAAWNALLFGYKRWFLLPPFHFHGPTTIAMHEWARAHREPFAAELHECVQGPGEVLFVPQYWYHAVLNVSDCVGIAVELGPNSRLFQHQLDSITWSGPPSAVADENPRNWRMPPSDNGPERSPWGRWH